MSLRPTLILAGRQDHLGVIHPGALRLQLTLEEGAASGQTAEAPASRG